MSAKLESHNIAPDPLNKEMAMISIAISLKRIADALDGGPDLIRLAIYNGICEGLFASRIKP